MATKIHNGANGPAVCKAEIRSCPIGGEHFDSMESAQKAYEEKMEKESVVRMKKTAPTASAIKSKSSTATAVRAKDGKPVAPRAMKNGGRPRKITAQALAGLSTEDREFASQTVAKRGTALGGDAEYGNKISQKIANKSILSQEERAYATASMKMAIRNSSEGSKEQASALNTLKALDRGTAQYREQNTKSAGMSSFNPREQRLMVEALKYQANSLEAEDFQNGEDLNKITAKKKSESNAVMRHMTSGNFNDYDLQKAERSSKAINSFIDYSNTFGSNYSGDQKKQHEETMATLENMRSMLRNDISRYYSSNK